MIPDRLFRNSERLTLWFARRPVSNELIDCLRANNFYDVDVGGEVRYDDPHEDLSIFGLRYLMIHSKCRRMSKTPNLAGVPLIEGTFEQLLSDFEEE